MPDRGQAQDLRFRPRRLRRSKAIRRLVAETDLDPRRLVQPVFVEQGLAGRRPVPSMPGIDRLGLDPLVEEGRQALAAGLGGIILFGIPAAKDPAGTQAHAADGIVQQGIKRLKSAAPDLLVIGDVCLCEYTDHGHCGIVRAQEVDNDATLDALARMAVAQAEAGVDVVAPSAMMDGQVAALRAALDDAGFDGIPILSYAAKYASGFYGPFREAAGSSPQFGDRRTYQMSPANAREALREIDRDIKEGADMVLVKPGLPCLDIMRAARDRFDVPLGAYQVSGEYAMIKAAAGKGWIDEDRILRETLVSLRRAGADFIITYYAQRASRMTEQEP